MYEVYSPHSGKPALLTVQFTPWSLGLSYDIYLSIADTFKPAYSTANFGQPHRRTHTVNHSYNASTALPGTIFLLLWFEAPDQTIPITYCRGQCVRRALHIPHMTVALLN